MVTISYRGALAWASAIVLAAVAVAHAGDAQVGVVSHVLVLSDKCEDVSSLEAWKQTYNYFRKPNGKIASVDEIAAAVKQWHEAHPGYRHDNGKLLQFAAGGNWKKAGPELLATCEYFLPDGRNHALAHGWHSTMQEYDFDKAPPYECLPSMGYELNVQLREGEALTRNWFNQGRVNGWTDANILQGDPAILGLQRQLGDQAPGRIGNGVLEYRVPLAGGAFRRGALAAENLAAKADDGVSPALHVKDTARPAALVIRMPSSYVYLSGTLTFRAAVAAGGSIVVSLSDNQGFDWVKMAESTASGEQKIDLTKFVERRYDYRLKFEIAGAGTGLDDLRIVHDVQHSQAPLPTLREGPNTITFTAGRPEGTIALEGNPDRDAASGRQLSLKEFRPQVNNMNLQLLRPKGEGDATFKVLTPGEMVRLRMNIGYRARDARDSLTISVSFDEGQTFQPVEKLTGPTVGNTKSLTVAVVPAGKTAALVKFAGKEVNTMCLFGLRIDADYREPAGGFHPVQITYVWEEDGRTKTDVHVASQPKESYVIHCGPKTVVKSFRVEWAGGNEHAQPR